MAAAAMAAALLAVTGAAAQDPDAGTTAFELFRINHNARDVAMAGASIAVPGGLIGVSANPAASGYLQDVEAVVGYRSMVEGIWSGVLGFGMPLGRTGYWSLNVVNLSLGTIEETLRIDGLPVVTGREWRSDALSASLNWSRVVWRTLSLGASLKGIYEYMGTTGEYYSSDGFALDLGAQYRLLAGDRLVLGAVLRHLGFERSTYGDEIDRASLPTTFGIGLSYVPLYVKPLRIALDLEKSNGGTLDIEPGIEVSILRDLLFLRAGYAFSDREVSYLFDVLGGEQDDDYEKAQWNSLCLGMGLQVRVRDVLIGADAGLEIHTVGQPSVAVTVMVGF